MDNIDDVINEKVCKFYPGDSISCIKDIPIQRIKIVGSILIIILGILIFRKSNDWIIKFVSGFINKFAKLIGITLIVGGLLFLNKYY
jgi:hypothetical protein